MQQPLRQSILSTRLNSLTSPLFLKTKALCTLGININLVKYMIYRCWKKAHIPKDIDWEELDDLPLQVLNICIGKMSYLAMLFLTLEIH